MLRASVVRTAVLRSSLRARLLSAFLSILAVVMVVAVAMAAIVGIPGTSTASGSPLASIAMTPTPWASAATAAPTVSPTPVAPTRFLIAVVVRYDDTRQHQPWSADGGAGRRQVTVPCEFAEVGLGLTNLTISSATPCLPAASMTAMVHDTAGTTALLPPALVTPSVKVLAVGNTDLFGAPSVRSRLYSLAAGVAAPVDWTAYDKRRGADADLDG